MSNLRNFTFLFLFAFLGGNVNAQVEEQLIVYMTEGSTNQDLIDLAVRWNSVVIEPLAPGGSIGVIQPQYYPFPNPFDPSEPIVNIKKTRKGIIEDDIEGDGGEINRFIPGSFPGTISASCYDDYSLEGQLKNTKVKVAVIDSGVNHEDASSLGYDFSDVEEIEGDATDNNGHGTHVATTMYSTYGPQSNGSHAVSYVFGNPLNNGTGGGTLSDLMFSLEKAIRTGANVINCSFSFTVQLEENGGSVLGLEGDPLYLLMEKVDPLKVLFVCAAGNEGENMDGSEATVNYPAAYDLPNIISVASVDCDGTRSSFSNYGYETVDIAAPGNDIVSLNHEMDLVSYSGTSQATAFVSGAAIILGSNLSEFDAPTVKCAILGGAQAETALEGLVRVGGVLDVYRAHRILADCSLLHGGGDHGGGGEHGGGAQIPGKRSKAGNENLSVFPNPFTSNVVLTFDLETNSDVAISVFNSTGQLVHTEKQLGQEGSNELTVNFEELLANNYYIVRLETNSFTSNTRIIKGE